MRGLMKAVAILALLVTTAAACLVLYGIHTLTPEVVSVTTQVTEAADVAAFFEEVAASMEEESFIGRRFAAEAPFDLESSRFVSYTVRLQNKGFFPAEWIALSVIPVAAADGSMTDIAQLGETNARVLNAKSTGDLSATILTTISGAQPERTLSVECYVFGQRIAFDLSAGQ